MAGSGAARWRVALCAALLSLVVVALAEQPRRRRGRPSMNGRTDATRLAEATRKTRATPPAASARPTNRTTTATAAKENRMSSRTARMKTERNIRYNPKATGDPDRTSLDVYAPVDAVGAPILVFIHGGGWQRGDKSRQGGRAGFFVERGWVYIATNYRLVPDVSYPTYVQDVADAVAWVHDHAAEFGGDPDAIFLMGHSAGAHLAALVGADERRLEAAGKDLSVLKGVIPIDTNCYDIPRLMNELGAEGAVSIYTAAFGEDVEVWRDASPAARVEPDKDIPPYLILHADGRLLKRRQTRDFAAKLEAAGVHAEVYHARGKNHSTIARDLGRDGDPATGVVMEFLESLR